MYVDKTLSGIQAVQALSRLNRAHPKKHDVFVLDFLNDTDTIRDSFASFYRTTILADETDPDKLHDLQADLDGAQVYSTDQLEDFVKRYLSGADRDRLDPILDACVAVYLREKDEDGQVEFKGKAKGFVRTYGFLSSVLSYVNAEWEKRSIFLNFLIPKLPAPQEPDLSKGILDAIDMDSYRVEKRKMEEIVLADEDAEIDPVPTTEGGHRPEPEMDRLSNIVREFNDLFGNIDWEDDDRVRRLITETIPARVAADTAFRNARQNSDKQNARIEHDKALLRVMTSLMKGRYYAVQALHGQRQLQTLADRSVVWDCLRDGGSGVSCIERQHRPNPEPVFTPLNDCGGGGSTTTYPRLNQRGTLVSGKYSTLIHFVPSAFPPSGEYSALKITDGPHGFGSLLFTSKVFPEPQPELLVQGGVFRHSTPARRCNQVLVSAQGNIFHDHLFNRRITLGFKCRQRTPGPVHRGRSRTECRPAVRI